MMKGSSGGRGFGGNNALQSFVNPLALFSKGGGGNSYAGTGNQGVGVAVGQGNYASNLQQMPAYVNYQQMPTYSSSSVAPSDMLMRFLSSGYASGGVAEDNPSLEADIEAAIRLARMIGRLTKNL